ncbi:ferrous iron transport protein B [Streptococcus anginosus]|uniref:ferrous iron transport protein B n=1 Tax=Streptococcus anginosus TaxID=1328 RepID=UPI00066CF4CE|nr:ferrous iron transport protein B [Streptococcus anginosus]
MKELALAGNPNSGKTSLFNILTGSSQHVGNWPGVTVEKKSGLFRKNKEIIIQDLPGIYSLSPYTSEEMVSRNYLLSGNADAILDVVDATNLERNLYLSLQLIETGIPVVLALNMSDVVEKQGKWIDTTKLSYQLGVPVVATSALKKTGIDQVMRQALREIERTDETIYPIYDSHFEAALSEIIRILGNAAPQKQARFYAIKLFERDKELSEQLALSDFQKTEIEDAIRITEEIYTEDAETIVVNARYEFIEAAVKMALQADVNQLSLSDKIDRIVTNRYLALPIFALVMWLVYFLSIQTIGTMGTDWTNDILFGEWIPNGVKSLLEQLAVADWLQSLIIDGIIAGCGAVLGFVPQIFVLFICLGILEDIGYMSRIAFVMDRIFRRFGLSGKSFIPMLISTGCGVPGVMASRTIENERDRRITIMTTTFMPCSAKLPIISLIAGAFFPDNPWIAPSAYFVGMGAIILSGIALKKTASLGGAVAPFIMELPSYHLPQVKTVLRYAGQKALSFIKRAGTIIFVTNIFIWFASSYNFSLQAVETENSILATLGKGLAWIFTPLGFGNWRATVAAITGLLAKETVISTFGILYKVTDATETTKELWTNLQQHYTALSAYSFLVFNLLCAPCFAAIGAIHREMGNAKWTWIAISFQTLLAYNVSLVIYQFGQVLLYGKGISFGTIFALFVVAVGLYFIFRKPRKEKVEVITLDSLTHQTV